MCGVVPCGGVQYPSCEGSASSASAGVDAIIKLTDAATYSNSVTCVTTLVNPDNTPIRISFTAANIESGYDYLYVYDGASTSGTLLGTYTGTSFTGTTLTTTSSECWHRWGWGGGGWGGRGRMGESLPELKPVALLFPLSACVEHGVISTAMLHALSMSLAPGFPSPLPHPWHGRCCCTRRPAGFATFRFTSDSSVAYTGFTASVSTKCPAGKYSSSGWGYYGDCALTPAGTYAGAQGTVSPTYCPAATPYSPAGSTSASACTACTTGCDDDTYGKQACADSSWTFW